MSLFRGIRRVYNEGKEDDNLIKQAAGRQPIFNNKCRYRYFGFYDLKSMPFYQITGWSSAPRPSEFKVCQECFLSAIAPSPLAKRFVRELKSSKDPEQLVQCAFSDPRNEPAWTACVQQKHEAPFMQWLAELAVMEANLAKCPSLSNDTGFSTGFRIQRSQRELKDSFTMCEYHFAAGLKGTWVADEYVRWPAAPSSTKCSYGAAEDRTLIDIAMMIAMRAFNFKLFEDWITAYKTLTPCCGIIEPGSKEYTLPAAKYTSKDTFRVCERCYRLIFEPHGIVRSRFKEVVVLNNGPRGVCSINPSSIQGYVETLLKATWKQESGLLLDYARLQAPIPPCPGSVNASPMRVWYASIAHFNGQDEPVTCCESCFHEVVRPSKLYASFTRFANASAQESNCCLMSMPEVRNLYATACTTGKISTFHDSMLQLAQKVQNDAATAQSEAQAAKRDSEQPESDLSRVRGTPAQIKEIERLRDEIVRIHAEAESKMAMAWNKHQNGQIRGMGVSPGIPNHAYKRVSDGHGNWFNTESEAISSQMMIEARFEMNEAWELRRKVLLKRSQMSEMKKLLTPAE